MGRITSQPANSGALAVFEVYTDSVEFIKTQIPVGTYVICSIAYVPTDDIMWYELDGERVYLAQRTIPNGTHYASSVLIVSTVSQFKVKIDENGRYKLSAQPLEV